MNFPGARWLYAAHGVKRVTLHTLMVIRAHLRGIVEGPGRPSSHVQEFYHLL